MATRFDWFDACEVVVDVYPSDHPDHPEAYGPDEDASGLPALVLSVDDALVLLGSRDDLLALACRITSAVLEVP